MQFRLSTLLIATALIAGASAWLIAANRSRPMYAGYVAQSGFIASLVRRVDPAVKVEERNGSSGGGNGRGYRRDYTHWLYAERPLPTDFIRRMSRPLMEDFRSREITVLRATNTADSWELHFEENGWRGIVTVRIREREHASATATVDENIVVFPKD